MYTYRDLIRKYAHDVAAHAADHDLSPRQRRVVEVMLNLASNWGGWAEYPPSDAARDAVCKYLAEIVWNARPLCEAMVPGDKAGTDFSTALDRALAILRNI